MSLNAILSLLTVRAGIAIGLIDDIPTCASLIERIDQEASDVIKGLSGLIDSQNKAKL